MTPEELEIAKAACCVGTIWDEYEGKENFDHMVGLRVKHLIKLVRNYHQPSLPSNLDEAAENHFETMEVLEHENIFEETHHKIFKAGAELMAEQGITKEAVIGMATEDIFINVSGRTLDELDLCPGDKVVVQIRKK